jgi:hypothetical protein
LLRSFKPRLRPKRRGLVLPLGSPIDEIFQPERFATRISGMRWVKRGGAVFVERFSEEAEDLNICFDRLISADEFFRRHEL